MIAELGFDGGVLEYSTNGTTWNDAGSMILEGGYNVTLASSPLLGRQAWSGDLGGWNQVLVDLASLEGQSVTFRWRFATDLGGFPPSTWYLDDVALDAIGYVCDPPPFRQGPGARCRGDRPSSVDCTRTKPSNPLR